MPRRKLTSEDRVRVVGGRKLLVRPDEVPVASNARWLVVEVTGWARPPWRSYKVILRRKAKKNLFQLGVNHGERRLSRCYGKKMLDQYHPGISDWVLNVALQQGA